MPIVTTRVATRRRSWWSWSWSPSPTAGSAQLLGHDHNRVVALAGAAARYWDQPGWRDRTLGDLLKVIPADQAALIHRFLVLGGWLTELPPEAEG